MEFDSSAFRHYKYRMNIFNEHTEFVNLDPRRLRPIFAIVTAESLYKRLKVQLPAELITGRSVLDLGSCLGAAGHYALTNGAREYTGVEIQDYYVEHSNIILSKYWLQDQFKIIQQDIEEFLDNAIAVGKKYDYVVASGVIYCFLDIISIIKKINLVTEEAVVFDNLNWPTFSYNDNFGEILIDRRGYMNNPGTDNKFEESYYGVRARISTPALDLIMGTCSFQRTEPLLLPELITGVHDPYNTKDTLYENGRTSSLRYMARYQRTNTTLTTLHQTVINDVQVVEQTNAWVFDDTVAVRFQEEAVANIPSYNHVIDWCLDFANKNINKTDRVIDVGSALGFTIDKFINAGYTNVAGVDNSTAMIAHGLHSSLVINSNTFPIDEYKLVLANWTLHFVKDKAQYLQDIYDSLTPGGYLILSDKTTQSELVKNLYYDFKRQQGLSEEYIKEKEQKLVGVMHSVSAEWYLKQLRLTGFATSDIINSDRGFVTFLCVK